MCIEKVESDKCKMINRNKLGKTLRGVLTDAKVERRLVCGLLPAISHLEKSPDEVLLCVLPQTNPGDAGTHMQTVLLQAFCYENFIPVIQVDSGETLAECCDIDERIPSRCLCAIVTKRPEDDLDEATNKPISPTEQYLTDFYECTLEEFPRPVIKLAR